MVSPVLIPSGRPLLRPSTVASVRRFSRVAHATPEQNPSSTGAAPGNASPVDAAPAEAPSATPEEVLPPVTDVERVELELIGPEPARMTIGEGQLGEVMSGGATLMMRMGLGATAYGYSASIGEDTGGYSLVRAAGRKLAESAELLEFYEFESCPFCRKVREALSVLDLDALYYPCPKDGPTWRPKAVELGGKAQFPFMVDPNTGTSMYESADIIRYLYKEYGPGEEQIPALLSDSPIASAAVGLAMLPRLGKGGRYQAGARIPERPLVFWAYEPSPFCKVVREALCELELPFIQKYTPRGSQKREELFEKRGLFQVPYLEDPNQGVALFESAAIVRYLKETYGAASTASETEKPAPAEAEA